MLGRLENHCITFSKCINFHFLFCFCKILVFYFCSTVTALPQSWGKADIKWPLCPISLLLQLIAIFIEHLFIKFSELFVALINLFTQVIKLARHLLLRHNSLTISTADRYPVISLGYPVHFYINYTHLLNFYAGKNTTHICLDFLTYQQLTSHLGS